MTDEKDPLADVTMDDLEKRVDEVLGGARKKADEGSGPFDEPHADMKPEELRRLFQSDPADDAVVRESAGATVDDDTVYDAENGVEKEDSDI